MTSDGAQSVAGITPDQLNAPQQPDLSQEDLLLKQKVRWRQPYRKAQWAVSEDRREQERHAVRCHGITG